MKIGLYKHSKTGMLYQVLGLALSTTSLEEVVVYQALYGDYGMWTRPKVQFESLEDSGIPKFVYVGKSLNKEKSKRILR